jgi:hypothetical protein
MGPALLGSVMIPAWYFFGISKHSFLGLFTTVSLLAGSYLLAFVLAYRITSFTKLRRLVIGDTMEPASES